MRYCGGWNYNNGGCHKPCCKPCCKPECKPACKPCNCGCPCHKPTPPVVGGWSDWAVPTTAEVQIFNQALGTLASGVTYTPLYVIKKVTNGTSYIFWATRTNTNDTVNPTINVLVEVYVSTTGTVELVSLKTV